MTMLIHGLLVTAEDDNTYSVRDCNRVLGHIVRHFIPQEPYPSTERAFRAFGEDFKTLSDACAGFLKIKGCRPRNTLGDCEDLNRNGQTEDYINKLTHRLQPGLVFGPNNETACLDRGRSPGEWMLKHNEQVRWGNTEEIKQDIDHFETFGKLPERKVGWF